MGYFFIDFCGSSIDFPSYWDFYPCCFLPFVFVFVVSDFFNFLILYLWSLFYVLSLAIVFLPVLCIYILSSYPLNFKIIHFPLLIFCPFWIYVSYFLSIAFYILGLISISLFLALLLFLVLGSWLTHTSRCLVPLYNSNTTGFYHTSSFVIYYLKFYLLLPDFLFSKWTFEDDFFVPLVWGVHTYEK